MAVLKGVHRWSGIALVSMQHVLLFDYCSKTAVGMVLVHFMLLCCIVQLVSALLGQLKSQNCMQLLSRECSMY